MKYRSKSTSQINQMLLLFFILLALAFSQEKLSFQQISIPEGLSNPSVYSIAQDSEGFMWMATGDGLHRYDGYDFRIYKNDPTKPGSLPSNYTWTVMVDSKDRIWIGGYLFVARYDPQKEKFISAELDRGSQLKQPVARSIFEDSQGRIWATFDFLGTQLLDPDSMKTRRVPLLSDDKNALEEPESMAWGILETRDGTIYSSNAMAGLLRYNDNRKAFEKVKIDDYRIPNLVFDMHEDEFGMIWIASQQNGLQVYDPDTGKLKSINLTSDLIRNKARSGILSLMQDRSGFLWIGTEMMGVFRYNPVRDQFVNYSEKNNFRGLTVGSIFQDSYGSIWLGTDDEGINLTNPDQQQMQMYRLPQNSKTNSQMDRISAIAYQEKHDRIILGTAGAGLFFFDPENRTFRSYVHDPARQNSLSHNEINDITVDNKDNIWVGTELGLDRIDAKSGNVNRRLNMDQGLNVNRGLNDVIIDRSGRLYLATPHGVDIYFPEQNRINPLPSLANRTLRPDLKERITGFAYNNEPIASITKVGEQSNLSRDFSIDQDQHVLVVCVGEGRVNFDMFDFGWLSDEKGDTLWAMNRLEQTFHVGGGLKNRISVGVLPLKAGKYKLNFVSDLGHSYGNWNVSAPDDSLLWGIQAFAVEAEFGQALEADIDHDFKNSSSMQLEEALSICLSADDENTLWIGTLSQGIFKYNLIEHTYKNYLIIKDQIDTQGNNIFSVFEDNEGMLWFTSQNGLGRLDPATDEMKIFTEMDGLPTNHTRGILEDNFGDLWISSLTGLTRMVKTANRDEPTFINYDIREGLQGYIYTTAAYKSMDGTLFFGGNNGFNVFTPGRPNRIPPRPVLTDFRILERSVLEDMEDSPFTSGLNSTVAISLPFAMNDITLQFASIHYSRPDRNKVVYKLEGFHKDWVNSGLRMASFTNLNPGYYLFRLKAANSDGVWNSEEKTLAITILPPWYMTWWSYGLYIMLFFTIILGVRKFELNRKMKNARIKESELKAKAAELQAKAAEAQNRAIQAENQRKTKELEEARELQLSMLPREVPIIKDYEIAVYMKTATEVGGDYYDFSKHDNDSLNIAIGDATGHGMKAGTLVASMKSLFTANSVDKGMIEFFESSNTALKKMHLERVMMGFAMLHLNGESVSLINAGMPPLYHYIKKKKKIEEIKLNGMPLGAMEQSSFEQLKLSLASGDTLLMLSDGMPELRNRKNEMFGYERLASEFMGVAEKSSDEIIEHLKNTGSDWVEDKDPEDDVTFVVIKAK